MSKASTKVAFWSVSLKQSKSLPSSTCQEYANLKTRAENSTINPDVLAGL
jgi:hypothetical protein